MVIGGSARYYERDSKAGEIFAPDTSESWQASDSDVSGVNQF